MSTKAWSGYFTRRELSSLFQHLSTRLTVGEEELTGYKRQGIKATDAAVEIIALDLTLTTTKMVCSAGYRTLPAFHS